MFLRRALRVSVLLFTLLGWGAPPLPAQGAGAEAQAEGVRAHYAKREVLIPMRDGRKLFTAIYTPKDTRRAYPILMQRTPYSVWPYGEEAFPEHLGPSPRFQAVASGALVGASATAVGSLALFSPALPPQARMGNRNNSNNKNRRDDFFMGYSSP